MEYPAENQPTPLARREEVVIQELADEVLVYDLRRHKAHCLNKSAAFIWDHCDGATSVSELAQRAHKEFNASIDESMVWQTLDRLSKANLLTESVKHPGGERLRSRRAMLGKLSAAAMLSVPVVMSITAPSAMAGASVCIDAVQCSNPINCDLPCMDTMDVDCVSKHCAGNGNCVGNNQAAMCM